MKHVVVITNVPAPYRIPTFNLLANSSEFTFTIIFCAERYPNTTWDYGTITVDHIFLNNRHIAKKNKELVFFGLDILRHLFALNPDIVVTAGFYPTALLAFAYAKLFRKIHIALSDGTLRSEDALSALHKRLRYFVYKRSAAFIAISKQTVTLFTHYGADPIRIHLSSLCTDNTRFTVSSKVQQEYDLIFCGRFIESKNPIFAIEVASILQSKFNRSVSMLFVGSGPLEGAMRKHLAARQIDKFHFHGFVNQKQLPECYAKAKIFLFPTLNDTWGMVVNEACAAGLPIIASPFSGAAGELIIEGHNGFICDLDCELWASKIETLLTDSQLYSTFSENSQALVGPYTFENASLGIINAVRQSLHNNMGRGYE